MLSRRWRALPLNRLIGGLRYRERTGDALSALCTNEKSPVPAFTLVLVFIALLLSPLPNASGTPLENAARRAPHWLPEPLELNGDRGASTPLASPPLRREMLSERIARVTQGIDASVSFAEKIARGETWIGQNGRAALL